MRVVRKNCPDRYHRSGRVVDMACREPRQAIEPPPCRTMRMVGMDGAGARPGRVIRARHVEKSWPARASRNETLVETAAGGPSRSGPCATPHRSSATVSPERPSPICPARRRRSADSDELRGSPHCSRRARAWSWKKRTYDSTTAAGKTPSDGVDYTGTHGT